MSIVVKCSGCGKGYKLSDEMAGKRAKCKCGSTIVVPKPPEPEEDDDSIYGLAPADDSAAVNSLLDEELAPSLQSGPPGGTEEGPPSDAAEEPEKKKKKTSKKGEKSRLVSNLIAVGTVAGLLAFSGLIVLFVMWFLRPGFSSPEKVFAAHQEALRNRNWDTLVRTHSPESQETLLARTIMMVALPMAKDAPGIQAVLDKHGVKDVANPDGVAGDLEEGVPFDFAALMRGAEERHRQAVSAVEDKPMLYVELMAAIEAAQDRQLPENPVAAIITKKPFFDARQALARAELSELKVAEATAEAVMTFKLPTYEDPSVAQVNFKKIGSRWFIHITGLEDNEAFSTPFSVW